MNDVPAPPPTRPDPRLAAPDAATLRPRAGDPARLEAYLPSPAVQNHAAQLAVLANGDLGCTWFGGTQEGIPDISIYFSRLAHGTDTWSPAVKLSDDPTRSEQNPILFRTPATASADGNLWLLHTAQLGGNQDTALVRRRISLDDGQTWGPAETLIPPGRVEGGPGYGVFVRQPPIVTPAGLWLLPVFRCITPAQGKWVGDTDTSAVHVSADGGQTWTAHQVPGSTGCVHMSIVPVGDGFAAFYRSRWADSIHRSHSPDGRTWSAPEPTELPNNNSSVQALALGDGRLAMVFNASSVADATGRRLGLYDDIGEDDDAPAAPPGEGRTAFWGAPRAPMTLALSSDGGLTWPTRRNLDEGDGFCMTNNSKDRLNREFSYPTVVQTPDGTLHVAYTYFRRAIKYVRIRPEWAQG